MTFLACVPFFFMPIIVSVFLTLLPHDTIRNSRTCLTREYLCNFSSKFFTRLIIFRYIIVFQIFRCLRLSEDPLTLSSDIEIGYTRIEIIRADLKQFTGEASLCTYISLHYSVVYTVKSHVKRCSK